HKSLQPRYKTFTWRLLRQALATGQRAGRFSQHIDDKCTRCGQIETDSHLFFNCDFARAVWFAGTPSIRTDLLQQGPQGVQKEARNDHRFNNKEWRVSNVLHAVKADIHITHTLTQELLAQASPPIQPQNTTPPNNSSIESFAGTKCYVDAAITPDVQRSSPRQAGLGIVIQGPPHSTLRNVFIQAITDSALNPLHAEANSLTLASTIIKALQLTQVQYMTDSQLLASNLQKQDPVSQAADWRIRHLLADFLCNSEQSSISVRKIPRNRNATAHTLAAQARTQADIPACLFVCNNPSHTSYCHVQAALQNSNWGVYRPISVSCL
ncbi:unnamed protein product, partial [Urochloa humidicola]